MTALVQMAETRRLSRPQLLTGAGGMGKSTIARLAALKFGEADQQRVWWISASNEERLSGGLVSMARDLDVSSAEQEAIRSHAAADLGGIMDRVWRLLERETSRWLLVVDGADNPALLGPPDGTGWVRNATHGLVLITTRNGDEGCWPEADLTPVGVLSPAAAAAVLMDLAPAAGNEEAARALAERLGCLPLALRIAGLELRQEFAARRTFEEYRRGLDRQGTAAIFSGAEVPDRRLVVTKTWELSLDALVRQGLTQARPLAWQLSCYAPGSRIPLEIITAPVPAAWPGPGPGLTAEQWAERCLAGLRGLRSVGLIQRSDAADGLRAIELHPLIAEITRANMAAADTQAGIDPLAVRASAATALCAAAARLDPGSARHWPYFRVLTPHVLHLLADSAPCPGLRQRRELLDCMVRCIASYMWSRAQARAEQLAETALELAGQLGAGYEAEILRLRHAHAWSLRDQDRLDDAEELFRQILAEQLDMPGGAIREDTLRTRHDLAWTVGRLGRWPEAETQFRDVLSSRRDLRRQRGEVGDDPDTLHTRCMLCWCVGRQGRWAEAERDYRLVAADRAAVLGPDHADTLDTRENIGKALAWQGLWEQAEREWRDTGDMREKTLGEEHPDTLRTRQLNAFAAGYLAWERGLHAGRRAAAGDLTQLLEVQIRVCGKDHKETVETCVLLAALGKNRPTLLPWPEDLPRPAGL